MTQVTSETRVPIYRVDGKDLPLSSVGEVVLLVKSVGPSVVDLTLPDSATITVGIQALKVAVQNAENAGCLLG